LAAGAVMVGTLWISRKAQTVTKTEVNLGRQKEGIERFDSSHLSRIIVRMFLRIFDVFCMICPRSVRRWVRKRLNAEGYQPAPGFDGKIPEFDLLRASVNLMVASALVSWATSMKLPLSTTYVTFMVAMGTSLSDQAWGLESAVYRVTGVLAVVGGWFFTAFMAFTVSLICAFAVFYLKSVAIIGLVGMVVLLIIRNFRIHQSREKASQELELLDLKRVTDAEFAIRICFEHSGRFLSKVLENLSECFEGILTQDRRLLKQLRRETSRMQKWSNIIVANIFKTLRLLRRKESKHADKYSYVVYALQEISESMRDLILRCHVHTSNQHSGLLPDQKKELQQVRKCMEALLIQTARILKDREPFEYRDVAAHYVDLKIFLDQYDHSQIERIRTGESKTRLSILYYGITNACLKISEQTLHLLNIFQETLKTDTQNLKPSG
jgi:Na+/phosphate symporter